MLQVLNVISDKDEEDSAGDHSLAELEKSLSPLSRNNGENFPGLEILQYLRKHATKP